MTGPAAKLSPQPGGPAAARPWPRLQSRAGAALFTSSTAAWLLPLLRPHRRRLALLLLISFAAAALGLSTHSMGQPMRWSEDFGRFGLDGAKAAMVFIGSGEAQPQLHNPNYDYPDGLTPTGVALLVEIVDQLLAEQGDAHPAPKILQLSDVPND